MRRLAKHNGEPAHLPLCVGATYLQVQSVTLLCVFSAIWCAILPVLANAASASKDSAVQQDPTALVREVVQNEIDAQLHDQSLWCFREQKEEDSKPQKTMEVCGTKEGNLERITAIDGRELSPAELEAEDQRIARLVAHPAQLRAKQKKEREDAEQTSALLKVLPDAFYFRVIGADGDLLKLSFWPNSAFHPLTRGALVFHHLQGTLVLDCKHKRIAEINGLLTSEVRFLGGLLGHLDKGGTFVVKAGQVTPDHWDVLLMNLDLSGRALFFKTISVHEKEAYADYTRVPDQASLQQVADLLKKECDSLHTALK
jgi:hypothetical protein